MFFRAVTSNILVKNRAARKIFMCCTKKNVQLNTQI